MKTNTPDDNASLRALLREWKVEASLPPRFNEQVWRRIERDETALASSFSFATLVTDWIATKLPRPALATAYLSALIVVGASVGWNQARQESARVTGDLRSRYVQAVDPYQTTP